MAHTFTFNKLAKFDFEFIVDGVSHIESIYIDMTDSDLPKRLMNVETSIQKAIDEIKMPKFEIKSESLPTNIETIEEAKSLTEEQIEDMKNISNAVSDVVDKSNKALIDSMSDSLGADVSNCFKYCNPLFVINGKYYAELFLEALSEEMVKYIKEHPTETAKVSSKPYMKKYLKR